MGCKITIPKDYEMIDDNKLRCIIDGCTVSISFSDKPNNDLYNRIKSILLSSVSLPQSMNNSDINSVEKGGR